MSKFNKLQTEMRNSLSMHIDELPTIEMLRIINREDLIVPLIIRENLSDIAKAVDLIYQQLSEGGSLNYIGAGTSGRLGLLDAFECPPTYGVSPDMVKGFIAGGMKALMSAQEENEDSYDDGVKVIIDNNIGGNDVVVGLTASGLTPYVLGAIDEAKKQGAKTIAIINNPNPDLVNKCDCVICVETGPEVITGSTRMKAGTAQKLILNMISTSVMIKLGKVYQNLMVDVQTTNQKLINRATKIIMEATNTSFEAASEALKQANYNAKLAILLIKLGCSVEEGIKKLNNYHGSLQRALQAE